MIGSGTGESSLYLLRGSFQSMQDRADGTRRRLYIQIVAYLSPVAVYILAARLFDCHLRTELLDWARKVENTAFEEAC
jgi:hypothetical protein